FETEAKKSLNSMLITDQTPSNRTRHPSVDRLVSSRQTFRASSAPEPFGGWPSGKSRVKNHEKEMGKAAESVSVLK
ncbi:MAG: hypothetical protein WCJ21_13425, partial [Planctomycetota bacterium]